MQTKEHDLQCWTQLLGGSPRDLVGRAEFGPTDVCAGNWYIKPYNSKPTGHEEAIGSDKRRTFLTVTTSSRNCAFPQENFQALQKTGTP